MKIEFSLNVHDPREVAAFQNFLSTVAEVAEERALSRPSPAVATPEGPVTEPKRGRGRPKKEESAVFAGDEEPRTDVFMPDGSKFSSVKTRDGLVETVKKLLAQCGDLDDVNGLWDANRPAIDDMLADVLLPFFEQARAAFAPKPPAVPAVDELRAALKDLANSADDGLETGSRILGEFGVSAVSAVPEDKRAAFLAAVKRATS